MCKCACAEVVQIICNADLFLFSIIKITETQVGLFLCSNLRFEVEILLTQLCDELLPELDPLGLLVGDWFRKGCSHECSTLNSPWVRVCISSLRSRRNTFASRLLTYSTLTSASSSLHLTSAIHPSFPQVQIPRSTNQK